MTEEDRMEGLRILKEWEAVKDDGRVAPSVARDMAMIKSARALLETKP